MITIELDFTDIKRHIEESKGDPHLSPPIAKVLIDFEDNCIQGKYDCEWVHGKNGLTIGKRYFFEDPEDATLFKLTFK